MKKNTKRGYGLSRLELLVAINGGAVLVLEIIGARLMAPFFGTSTYVWTAIIGVILLSLSVGYWYGGKIADKGASSNKLALMFMIISLVLALAITVQPRILSFLAGSGLSVRLSAFIAALSVYAVPTALMGVVSPYITKLSITNLKHSGETVGRLYAAGTIGSIFGTFLSGYWLTGYFTNESINWSIVVLFVILAVIADKKVVKDRIFQIVFVLVGFLLVIVNRSELPKEVIYQQDTPYARVQVIDTKLSGRPSRILSTDRLSIQSGILLDEPDKPAFEYLQGFFDVAKNSDNPQKILVVGGGAYTLPQLLIGLYPEAKIDVVEIDSELEQISKDYFNYRPTENVKNFAEDGRTFLNRNTVKYDVIFLDAFTSNQPPYHLSTIESFQAVRNSLSEDGIVAFNVIGSQSGARSSYVAALDRTFSSVFESTKVVAYNGSKPNILQNILILGGNKNLDLDKYLDNLNVQEAELVASDLIFTDSYAPTERLLYN